MPRPMCTYNTSQLPLPHSSVSTYRALVSGAKEHYTAAGDSAAPDV